MAYGSINGIITREYNSHNGLLEDLIIIKNYTINIAIDCEYYGYNYTKYYSLTCYDFNELTKIDLKIVFEDISTAIADGKKFNIGGTYMYGLYTFVITYYASSAI